MGCPLKSHYVPSDVLYSLHIIIGYYYDRLLKYLSVYVTVTYSHTVREAAAHVSFAFVLLA